MKPLVLLLGVALAGSSASAAPQKAKTASIPPEMGKQVVARYTDFVIATYAQAVADARELAAKVDALIKTPHEATLAAAREAWKAARQSYGPTEAFRFYGGPIDHPETGPEGMINAWPMDEAYLDYVKGQAGAGIINNPKDFPKIDKETLVALNEKNGEKNISTGYHAIEFLLWGQDLSATGPGDRKATDFSKQAPHGERRATALKVLSDLLVEHLSKVAAEWDPKRPGNYGELLKKEPLEESLRKIYTGLVSLSIDEMAGERMTVSLETNDQENEQSCFSDTTTADMIANLRGIRETYFKSGLNELVKAVDPALAQKTEAALKQSQKRLAALPASFDRVIASPSKSAMRANARLAIEALESQARLLAASGLKMGLVLNIQE